MRQRALLIAFGFLLAILIAVGTFYNQKARMERDQQEALAPIASPVPAPSASVSVAPSGTAPSDLPSMKATNPNPDLTVDAASGLSRATVILTTGKGVIKFKFYPKDAPQTVVRIVQLITKGFYNGLIFHRVEPDFVIQGGDPSGTGMGGSGEKLKAEFNDRRHVEGTVAMARGRDPDSADSQFYITLAPQPSLDRSYTVFGQVTEGMDVAKKIARGDKILSIVIE